MASLAAPNLAQLSRRFSDSFLPALAYHGCSHSVAERLLSVGINSPDKSWFQPSTNEYDWLGSGLYFWLDSPARAYDWALSQQASGKYGEENASVVGALIYPRLCLNLSDYGVIDEIKNAHDLLQDYLRITQSKPVTNRILDSGGTPLVRALDNQVINLVHVVRQDIGLPNYDTVYGFFEEGRPAYEGSGIREKTHVQIAVRDPSAIVGFFRVLDKETGHA